MRYLVHGIEGFKQYSQSACNVMLRRASATIVAVKKQ
jgi:hypothetical protein